MTIRILTILSILTLLGCSEPNIQITSHFDNMKPDLNLVIEQLHIDPIYKTKLNKYVRPNELKEKSLKCIRKLNLKDISYITLEDSRCLDTKHFKIEIIFNGNWYLTYDPCDLNFISPGEHSEMDSHFIETWGLDNHWYLWVNRDVIG